MPPFRGEYARRSSEGEVDRFPVEPSECTEMASELFCPAHQRMQIRYALDTRKHLRPKIGEV